MNHQHRAIKAESMMRGFSHCLTPQRCNQGAHGGVMRVDRCKCGAMRLTNENIGLGRDGHHHPYIERGSWFVPNGKVIGVG